MNKSTLWKGQEGKQGWLEMKTLISLSTQTAIIPLLRGESTTDSLPFQDKRTLNGSMSTINLILESTELLRDLMLQKLKLQRIWQTSPKS